MLSVRLTVAGSTDWRYLIVEDPLPAGVEAVHRQPVAGDDLKRRVTFGRGPASGPTGSGS